MRSKGLIIRPLGNTLVLMPIPAMGEGTLNQMLDIVIEVLATQKGDWVESRR
jgi:adenosylmethionine-8-amino-7-oxononanoate aminotransferase